MGANAEPVQVDPVVAIYRRALPHVYGYLLPRCGNATVAEDLTAETFMAAVTASRQNRATHVDVAWLIGVARHKLVDHWRRAARDQRNLKVAEQLTDGIDDPWEQHIDTATLHAALGRLSAHQRAALTLHYLDGLAVAEVAEHLDRSLHATETLLARARAALRRVYREDESHDA
ncbi:MAG: RNA polymerase sigma factor [Acidimicrobiales bacterium]